jgi:hypothetical protein
MSEAKNSHLLSGYEQYFLEAMEALNTPSVLGAEAGLNTRLHSGQIRSLKPLFDGSDTDVVFLACGRKFGKTEAAMYALWRYALTHPNTVNYYIAPENEHARKLVWDGQRLQKFLGKAGKNFIKRINGREMKITLLNDSIIQVVGSENWQVANGLTPNFSVYDEFKVFHPKWHTEYNPNRLAKGAPLLIIGTPPKPGDKNAEEYLKMQESVRVDSKSFLFRMDSYQNPVIKKEIIDREIEKLRAAGDEDIVQREYYARIVPGGKKAIFPMLNEKRHKFEHYKLVKEIERDIKKMDWYCAVDPGTTTVFAGLLIAINPYTKIVYVLDEIYEKDQQYTSVRNIFPKLRYKMMELYPNSSLDDDWFKVYDEAAAWFASEVMDQYGTYFSPTEKHINKKEEGISLIKDMLMFNCIKISDRCENLWKEMEQYAKDDRGNIPKKNDHNIDSLRYALAAAHYNMVEALEGRADTDMSTGKPKRYRTMRDDFKDMRKEVDWTINIDDEYDL